MLTACTSRVPARAITEARNIWILAITSSTDSAMTNLVPSVSVRTVSGVDSARSMRSQLSDIGLPFSRVTMINLAPCCCAARGVEPVMFIGSGGSRSSERSQRAIF